MNLKCTLWSERSQSKKGEYDSNHMLIYKRQDYRDNKEISVAGVRWKGRVYRQVTENF